MTNVDDQPNAATPSPFPSDAELKRAQRKVVAAGGRLIGGPHTGEVVMFKKSPQKISFLGRKFAPPANVELTGCGHSARVEIPHMDHKGRHQKLEACLICDSLYISPNYDGSLE